MSKQNSPEVQAGPDSAQKVVEQVMPSTVSTKSPTAGVENGNTKPSKNEHVTSTDNFTEKPSAVSPNSKKRALAETPEDDQGTQSKKPRDSLSPPSTPNSDSALPRLPSPSDHPATVLDKENWLGFCDIESEPAYFSVILREMGVQGVTVREVFHMDPETLSSLPQPIYGLILLYGYREFGKTDEPATCPPNMWFANQLPAHNSCATLAMINILMNSSDVDVGEHLTQFKDFTREFPPYQRGEALGSFDFVRKIHNSFAKKMDILEADKNLSYKVHKAARESANDKSTEATKKKKPPVKKPSTTSDRTSRTRARAPSTDTAASDDSAKLYEERAHHYIAFIPSGASAWKLDGLDAAPTYLDTCDVDTAQTWLDPASDAISALMAADSESDHVNDYAIFALTQSPLVGLRSRAKAAFGQLRRVEARLDVSTPGWRNALTAGDPEPPSPMLLGVGEDDDDDDEDLDASSTSTPTLFTHRTALITQLSSLAGSIIAEIQSEADDETKASQRRFDAGPVIKSWLEMLAENGHLEGNLTRFVGK